MKAQVRESAPCENLRLRTAKYFEDSVEGNLTQTDDYLWLEDLDFAFEIGLTGIQLCWRWFVVGRSASA